MTVSGPHCSTCTCREQGAVATRISFDTRRMIVDLRDGRVLHLPLDWFPKLRAATLRQLCDWRLVGDGEGIHWQELDEDLSVAGLLRGKS